MKNIVIFTSDVNNGAMYQIACTLTEKCVELGFNTTAFFPDIKSLIVSDINGATIKKYNKVKSLNIYNKAVRSVSDSILSTNPDFVIFVEDAIFSMEVLYCLGNRVKSAFMIHDVNPHPTSANFKKKLTIFISQIYRKLGIKKAYKTLLLSNNGMNNFISRYGKNDNLFLFPLGAHPPICKGVKIPVEINCSINNYFLFFGRIDKYKGIKRLLESFENIDSKTTKIIIAGKGQLSAEEQSLAEKNSNVILINRFIEDEEVLWLFTNTKCVVLPYIEASQSGVLPIAYCFGKPVICSDIPGLNDYVEVGKTGHLFSTNQELANILSKMVDSDQDYSAACLEYSNTQLNWKSNLQKLINS